MSSFFPQNAGMYSGVLAIQDEDKSDLWQPRFDYCFQMRCKEIANNAPQSNSRTWAALWSAPRIGSGDVTTPLALFGQDETDIGRFEWPSTISRGMVRPYFFRGTCKDSNGNILGGANVHGFLTSRDIFVGETFCDSNGNYELPTIYSGQNHYLVAYYASGSLAGTTVNTLQPVQ